MFRHDPNDASSISYNSIIMLFEDRENRLWVGTWGGGLNRYDPQSGESIRYEANPTDSNSLHNGMVRTLAQDVDGNLWGGMGGGLDLLDPDTGKVSNIPGGPNGKQVR